MGFFGPNPGQRVGQARFFVFWVFFDVRTSKKRIAEVGGTIFDVIGRVNGIGAVSTVERLPDKCVKELAGSIQVDRKSGKTPIQLGTVGGQTIK